MKPSDLSELDWLQACIRGEAEGESIVGKLAVGCVIRTRVNERRWPDTYREVVLQPAQFESMAPLGKLIFDDEIPPLLYTKYFRQRRAEVWWKEICAAAWIVYHNWTRDIVKGANHFYAHNVVKKIPYWAVGVEPVAVIGGHTFLKL